MRNATTVPTPAAEPPRPDVGADGWDAQLALRFERVASRTVLVSRRHSGPLRVQKALYPEDDELCQVIVVHPPAGIVGGDTLHIDVDAQRATRVQVTTPGAAKWYRSSGRQAQSTTRVRVSDGALVEWLPQEALIYDGARAAVELAIDLAGDARFIGWDVTTLGRTASGERYASGRLEQRIEVMRDGKLAWCERAILDGGSRALHSGAILDGAPVFGTMLAAMPSARDLLAVCRDVNCAAGEGAVTAMHDMIVARFRGAEPSAARAYFANLWHAVRPALAGRRAVAPRIWST